MGRLRKRVPLIAGREVTGAGAACMRLATADVGLIHARDRIGPMAKPWSLRRRRCIEMEQTAKARLLVVAIGNTSFSGQTPTC